MLSRSRAAVLAVLVLALIVGCDEGHTGFVTEPEIPTEAPFVVFVDDAAGEARRWVGAELGEYSDCRPRRAIFYGDGRPPLVIYRCWRRGEGP